MAKKIPAIPEELNRTFPAQLLRHQAKRLGAVQRFVKVDIVVFFWTLVLAPSSGLANSLSALGRFFQMMSGITLARSAFQKRFTKTASTFLLTCVQHALGIHLETCATPAIFKHFKEVLAIDSTLIALADALASVYPGPRKNSAPACLKVNAVYSVLSASLKQITIAKGTKAESKLLRVGRDVAETLLLIDLGYFCYALFGKIIRFGGFFISRLKKNANPRIIADRHTGPGRCRNLVGLKVWDAVKGLGRDVLDVDVEVNYREKCRPSRKHAKKTVQRKVRMRVVGVRHPDTGKWHLYLTNVPAEQMTPEQIRVGYSARWLVELVFDDLKNACGMEEFPSERPEVVQALVYAAVIRFTVSRIAMNNLCRRLLQGAQAAHGEHMREMVAEILAQRARGRRFLNAWNSYALLILPAVLEEAGIPWDTSHLDYLLLDAMMDPNKCRDTLFRRLSDA